jgi:iron complex outermembrane receptor protein
MNKARFRTITSLSALATVALSAAPAWSREDGQTPADATDVDTAQEVSVTQGTGGEAIVITGSRIRRADATTSAPVAIIDNQSLVDRGFIQAGQALNQISSIVPATATSQAAGSNFANGQTFPNLFGLGAGRTLTLVNGRRFVTSSSGLGDAVVDTNIIPSGLIERIDVVQAGGAAVYGSDAIAGVINYVLKDDFDGLELDAQQSISSRGDLPETYLRATAGRTFFDGRANVAFNIEYSHNDSLRQIDRPITRLARFTSISNPQDTGPSDGIPPFVPITNARLWEFNRTGVIFTVPAPVAGFLLRSNGLPTQFDANGHVVPYDIGSPFSVPFAQGGEGYDVRDVSSLYPEIERITVAALGRYEIASDITLSGEFIYADVESTDPLVGLASNTVINAASTGLGAIPFTINNPYLTPEAIATLTTARPQFAAGAPLFLSRSFDNLLPTREGSTRTKTWRALLSLEGRVSLGTRDFDWSISASRGQTEGRQQTWGLYTARLNNAISVARNQAGQIVCAINADAIITNDDLACTPINIFGTQDFTQAQRDYVSLRSGRDFKNTQDDFLALLGGDIVELPGGTARFSLSYEHRREQVEFVPFEGNRLGLIQAAVSGPIVDRGYNTDEGAVEVLIPLVGGDFTLPLVRSLELSGAYRIVDNSIVGTENVWSVGARWEFFDGLILRGSRSRNFRAPTLNQLFAPAIAAAGNIFIDPCDVDRINAGINPAVRRQNCEALFAANPGYGPLNQFQAISENTNFTQVTTRGNSNLRNEVSDTLTFGVVFQPSFIPGLTMIADRIEVDLRDGLSAFTPQNFLETCFDVSPQPADICGTFTRDAQGQVVTATSTTFNAGRIEYRGEVYSVNYRLPLERITGRNSGTLELNLEATHTSRLLTSVTGLDRTRSEGTVAQPDWVARFDARYSRGPLRLTYSLFYLPAVKANPTATPDTSTDPIIAENIRHSISMQYQMGALILRAGVNNLTDEQPSFPTRNYGDILGRQYYVGARLNF